MDLPGMTDDERRMAAAAGLHIGAGAGGLIAIALQRGIPTAEVRAAFLETCTALFDDVLREAGRG